MCIRAGISLGLNLRNESDGSPAVSKEIRYRVWWATYTLERTLSVINGRPTNIADLDVTTPVPVPLDESAFQSPEGQFLLSMEAQRGIRHPGSALLAESGTVALAAQLLNPDRFRLAWTAGIQPTDSLYFLHHVQLSRLAHEIYSKLYSPRAMTCTWADIEKLVTSLDEDLTVWYGQLPPAFDFRKNPDVPAWFRQRLSLGVVYHNSRMMLHRPCLCRMDRKIPRQSAHSRELTRAAAQKCVQAAIDLLTLLPPRPDVISLYVNVPWWTMLHFLVQATVVMMIEISFRVDHMPGEADNILRHVKKALTWLEAMGKDSLAASRAYDICEEVLRGIIAKIGRDMDDMPSTPNDMDVSPTGYFESSRMSSDPSTSNASPSTYQIFGQPQYQPQQLPPLGRPQGMPPQFQSQQSQQLQPQQQPPRPILPPTSRTNMMSTSFDQYQSPHYAVDPQELDALTGWSDPSLGVGADQDLEWLWGDPQINQPRASFDMGTSYFGNNPDAGSDVNPGAPNDPHYPAWP